MRGAADAGAGGGGRGHGTGGSGRAGTSSDLPSAPQHLRALLVVPCQLLVSAKGTLIGPQWTARALLFVQAETRENGALVVRLTVPVGISTAYSENDVLLLSRDNPVRWAAALFCG